MIVRRGRHLVGPLLLLPTCLAVINLKELRDVIYDISLENVPAGFEDFTLGAEVTSVDDASVPDMKVIAREDANALLMASALGQRFICWLPSVNYERSVGDYSTTDLNVDMVAEVVSAAFYIHNCIRKNLGWWTYEFCYNKHIEQLHVEGSENIGAQISLGNFVSNSPLPEFVAKADRQLYFEQRYADGTECDITHKPRSSLVRFVCDELLATSEAYIDSVDEHSSCEYVIIVKTGSLCKLDAFLPLDRPRKAVNLVCKPALDQPAAIRYVQALITQRQSNMEKAKLIEQLVAHADSIQRQRFARKRTTLNTPRSKRHAAQVEKKLKDKFENLMKLASRVNAEIEGLSYADVQVFDDIHEMEGSYASDEDEDRGNLYWFFMDAYWDRTFFPMNIAYVRAKNTYYAVMSKFFERIGVTFDYDYFTYAHFLRNIKKGEIGEKELRLLLGSTLTKAFREETIPGIADFMQPEEFNVNEHWYDIMWMRPNVLDEHLELFENEVLKQLVDNVHHGSADVISKVARQILLIQTFLRTKEKYDERYVGRNLFTFSSAEKIYLKFEEAYNRAIKRYDRRKQIVEVELRANRRLSRTEVISWMDITRPEELEAENAKMLVKSTLPSSEIDSLELLRMVEIRTKGKPLVEKEALRKTLFMEAKEIAAKARMIARGRRPNLSKKVEEYFRRPSDEYLESRLKAQRSSSFLDNGALKMQLDDFKRSIEKKIRDSGFLQEGDVKIEVFTAGLDSEGTWSSVGDEGEVGQASEIMKMLLAEQDRVDGEAEHHSRMRNAYMFGATREEKGKQNAEEVDSEDEQDQLIVSRMIPILRRAWLV
ncbi:Protein OS-9 [Toxocara canis]|uniref:Protein OS-9 n=1 Tax=Toxocara canis TaxID=6265 RepID=A0A0B2V7P2_TOXCA|nr:Protein OS-9 [Toxocara canis]